LSCLSKVEIAPYSGPAALKSAKISPLKQVDSGS
jgi:hypothetical protein